MSNDSEEEPAWIRETKEEFAEMGEDPEKIEEALESIGYYENDDIETEEDAVEAFLKQRLEEDAE